MTTLGKSMTNLWQNALEETARLNKGGARVAQGNPALAVQRDLNNPFELRIQEIQGDPTIPPARKVALVEAERYKQASSEQTRQQTISSQITREQTNIDAAEKNKPDAQFQQSAPGVVSSLAGQALPWLAATAVAPFATPMAAALQMTASQYDSTFNRAIEDSKKTHPEWSDERRTTEALAAAAEGAKGAGLTGVALSYLNIPAVGPLVSRIAQRLGITYATLATANVLARVQENIALKKSIDPELEITSGLMDVLKETIPQAVGFGLPHAASEIGRGKVPTTPQEPIESRPAVITARRSPKAAWGQASGPGRANNASAD